MTATPAVKPEVWTDEVVYDGPLPVSSAACLDLAPGGHRQAFVYLLFNESGDLLYVGRARVPANRFDHHRRHKEWWPDVARLVLSRVEGDSYHDAHSMVSRLEARLIRELDPIHNIVGKVT
jgi:hypothetical protein